MNSFDVEVPSNNENDCFASGDCDTRSSLHVAPSTEPQNVDRMEQLYCIAYIYHVVFSCSQLQNTDTGDLMLTR